MSNETISSSSDIGNVLRIQKNNNLNKSIEEQIKKAQFLCLNAKKKINSHKTEDLTNETPNISTQRIK